MKKSIFLIAFYLLSLVAMGRAASHFTAKGLWDSFAQVMEKTQVELSLNHLERYEELERDLSKGCQAAVLEKLKISIAHQRRLVADALKRQKNGELEQTVELRAPGLAQALANDESPNGRAWSEPRCE